MARYLDEREAAQVQERRLPPGVRHLAAWVRLCQDQGTRLVDVLSDWRHEARRANDIAERHAQAMERIADAMSGHEAPPTGEALCPLGCGYTVAEHNLGGATGCPTEG